MLIQFNFNPESFQFNKYNEIKYLATISKGEEYYESMNYGYHFDFHQQDTNKTRIEYDLTFINGLTKFKEYGPNGSEEDPILLYNTQKFSSLANIKFSKKNNIYISNIGAVNYLNIINGIENPNKEFNSNSVKDAAIVLIIEK